MNFDEFVKEMQENIKTYLPEWYENATVDVFQNQKLNDSYLGLQVKLPEQNIVPCINLDAMYEAYKQGMDFKDIASKAADMILTPVPELDTASLKNYYAVKNRLFVKVSSAEKNAEVLKNIPHTMIDDLAMTYHVLVQYDRNKEMASFTISNEHMEMFGVSPEQLHADAMKSTQEILPVTVEHLSEVLAGSIRQQMLEDGLPEEEIASYLEQMVIPEEADILVVSNEIRTAGASAIFYPDVLDQVAEKAGGNFFILPSSTEEVLVLPDNGRMNYRELDAMVCEVNDAQMAECEQLGNHVYHYDAEDKVFEKAAVYEARQAEKSKGRDVAKDKESVMKKLDDRKKEIKDNVKNTVVPVRAAGAELG